MSPVARNAERGLAVIVDGAGEGAGPLATATACVDGFANRLAFAQSLRNIDPEGAQAQLLAALTAWPVICRVMDELERSEPALAEQAARDSARMLAALDRRDRSR